MSQNLPDHIEPNSPNQLVFLLDSLISSPLCPHAQQWICYSYMRLHQSMVYNELHVTLDYCFHSGRATVKYGRSSRSRILEFAYLASYIESLNLPRRPFMSLEQVQLWRLTAKEPTLQRACSSTSEGLPEESSWFALQGEFTVGDFAKGRCFTEFIEMHWCRLLSQATSKWCRLLAQVTSSPLNEHRHSKQSRPSRGSWRCQSPGDELAPLLVSESFASLNGDTAEVVMKEVMSHVDQRILLFMGPELRQFENSRRQASEDNLEAWYTPESPVGRWNRVNEFKALAAIADRLVGAFERIKNHPQILSIAWAQLDQEIESLASQIKKK